MIPSPWETALLALAAYRVFRLLASDVILDRPREWLLGTIEDNGERAHREYWADFLTCAWCCGAWCAFAWWLAFLVFPHGTVVVAVLFALSAAVGAVAHVLD